jgi:hypothetical protein
MDLYTKLAIAAGAGLAVGTGVTYFATKKHLEKKYQAAMDRTINDLRAEYDHKIALATGEVEDEEVESETEESSEEEEEESSDDDDEESDPRSQKQNVDYTKFTKPSPAITIECEDSDDDEDYSEYEIIKKERPYLINVDTFNDGETHMVEDSRPWYDKKELILYTKDFVYVNGEKVSIPILYSCDDDCIVDICVDADVAKLLSNLGMTHTGDWERANICIDMEDFGHPEFDYKPSEQAKRNDSTETEYYIDKRDLSYADDMLNIETVTKENQRDVYRELWAKIIGD